MIKRFVKNNADPDYPKGERQLEYNKGNILFREPAKSPHFWPEDARKALVRMIRATGNPEAWEFLLKQNLGGDWYIVRIYPPGRRKQVRNMVVLDSASINVFVAQCCFYAIGYKRGVIEYSSDWQAEVLDEEINKRNVDEFQVAKQNLKSA